MRVSSSFLRFLASHHSCPPPRRALAQEAAFLGGARDAFFAVNELWPAGDAAALAPLTSPAVGAALRDTLALYAADGLHLSFAVRALRREPRVVRAALLFADEVGEAEPAESPADAEAGSARAQSPENPDDAAAAVAGGVRNFYRGRLTGVVGQLYLGVSVRYDSEEEVELRRGGPQGRLVRRTRDTRGHVWQWARPLPHALPAAGVETPWKLVNIL
jgi:hypothetical protein